MNNVSIVGHGSTKFTTEDVSIEEQMVGAVKNLFDNTKNLTQKEIDGVLISTNSNSKYLSAIISETLGIEPNVSHTVESLCNSGTNAIVSAAAHVNSKIAKTILVIGGDRHDSPGQILEWDQARGEFKHPIFWASIFTSAYKRVNKVNDEQLALVSVKNYKNARDNPNAYSDKVISVEDVLSSKRLTDDLRILNCSRPCAGASAILLADNEIAKKFTDNPIKIQGIGQKTISASFTNNPNLTNMYSTSLASKMAFDAVGWSPSDIEVMELHDAFSVCEPMALESIGITNLGNGMSFLENMIKTNEKIINPRGGLIGAGHPLGATGIAQTIEIVQQLQGTAGKRQVDSPKKGLIHNMSAAATSSTILLLES
ncbi:MAG: thiolase family protein [Crenarchaeota archaeon]|mgnify:CR=1 FL=1|nr:MAG: thiolase family protein [Thermoproteota archaeon]RDJ34144.1 MAG: thiolase family protein [Thermoproteota archaeon]RDJ36740.1 MAG: thiolase family protein [Thermoproteota archaeon]RDJ37726.1 MAG: thiolase family protein [Thermoproteota archaeon]